MQFFLRILGLFLVILTVVSSTVTAAGRVTVKLESITLPQPDEVLKKRAADVKELADYMKQIEAAAIQSFQRAVDLKPTTAAIVVAVKPRYQARQWLMSSEYTVPTLVSDDFRDRFDKIKPLLVHNGPVVFAMHFTVNGGGKPLVQGDKPMPMPEEWEDAARKSGKPLLVPEGILALIWPDDKEAVEPASTVPDGFELQPLDVTQGSILKPKGWHYRWFTSKDSIVWTVSKEDLGNGVYKTGLRIQFVPAVTKLVKSSPQSVAERFIHDKKKSAKVLRECSPEKEKEFTRICLETLEKITVSGEEGDYRILYTIHYSTERDAFVLMTFGSPDKDWDSVQRFYYHLKNFTLIGEDFWKKPKE